MFNYFIQNFKVYILKRQFKLLNFYLQNHIDLYLCSLCRTTFMATPLMAGRTVIEFACIYSFTVDYFSSFYVSNNHPSHLAVLHVEIMTSISTNWFIFIRKESSSPLFPLIHVYSFGLVPSIRILDDLETFYSWSIIYFFIWTSVMHHRINWKVFECHFHFHSLALRINLCNFK